MNNINLWPNERTILSTKFFERLIMQNVFNVFNVTYTNVKYILLFVMTFKYNLNIIMLQMQCAHFIWQNET